MVKKMKAEMVRAIREAEKRTSGEIRVHLKQRCGEDSLGEARKVFRRLGLERTRERNAVLIFVAPASRRFAVVGGEGIHAKVGEDFWRRVRDTLQMYFSKGQIEQGIVAGVSEIGEQLKKYFPIKYNDKNEISDTVSVD